MTFQPGQSGNPVGRPKGSVNRQLQMLREAAEIVLPLILDRALNGDTEAQKLIVERALPRLKPVAVPEPFNLPEGSLPDQMQALLQQIVDGEISVEAGTKAIAVIVATDKAKEIEVRNVVLQQITNTPPKNAYLAAVQAKAHTVHT